MIKRAASLCSEARSAELYWPLRSHLCIFFFLRVTRMVAAEGSGALFMRHTFQGATGFSWDLKTTHTTFCPWSLSSVHALTLSLTHTHTCTCGASVWPICCSAGLNHSFLSVTSVSLCDAQRAAGCFCSCRALVAGVRLCFHINKILALNLLQGTRCGYHFMSLHGIFSTFAAWSSTSFPKVSFCVTRRRPYDPVPLDQQGSFWLLLSSYFLFLFPQLFLC